MPDTRSLHRKLAQVMYEAGRIPKNGTAPAAMGGFKFVQVGDAADVIRKALAEHKVSMIPTAIELVSEADHATSSGKTMSTVTVRTTWTLTDADSDESIVIQSMGSGADMGDKAIPKAQTNAMKYALLMGFLLSTGDDPELSDSSDRRSERNLRAGAADHEPPAGTNGGLIGTAEKGTARTSDYAVRQSPDGPFLGFRLKDGHSKGGQLVEAWGAIAEALALMESAVIGQRVQVWGHFQKRDLSNGGSYQAFVIERIAGPDFTLPAGNEPESLPMFDPDAELDAAASAA